MFLSKTMSDEKVPEKSALEQLQATYERALRMLTLPEVAPLQAKVWINTVRVNLKRLLGPDSAVVRAWPGPDVGMPAGRHRDELVERVAQVERILAALNSVASGAGQARQTDMVFLGHGRSPAWLELREFLQTRLGLECIEFNMESAAGLQITERLQAMLDRSTFAFILMTAEDEHADGRMHARENVVHEAGLFQGKLGWRRAIVLLEEGCQPFSNIHGLVHIPFFKGKISTCFEDVRLVLEREGLIKP